MRLQERALEIARRIALKILRPCEWVRNSGLLEDAVQEAQLKAVYALAKADKSRSDADIEKYVSRACWQHVKRWRRRNRNPVHVPLNGTKWMEVNVVCMPTTQHGKFHEGWADAPGALDRKVDHAVAKMGATSVGDVELKLVWSDCFRLVEERCGALTEFVVRVLEGETALDVSKDAGVPPRILRAKVAEVRELLKECLS